MRRWAALVMTVVALAGQSGCATLHAPLMDGSCRDPSTGRYTSCGGGGSPDTTVVLGVIGVSAGIAAIAGLIYLATHSSNPPPPSPTSGATGDAPQAVTGFRSCRDQQGALIELAADRTCASAGFVDSAR